MKLIGQRVVVAALLQSPAAPKKGGNPEAAKVKNPVAASAESTAAGKRVYTRMCSRCHGPEGKGDGTAATAPVPDLTDAQWDYGAQRRRDLLGDPRRRLRRHGRLRRRLSDTDIWNVVNYVRSVAAAR